MTTTTEALGSMPAHPAHGPDGALLRTFVIGLIAFLTVVDLFATQAILPSLARFYNVSPAAMGFAVNASTIGMAIAGLAVAFFSRQIDRRRGIVVSARAARGPDRPPRRRARPHHIHVRSASRRGCACPSAFALTLSYLGEQCSAADAAGAFAGYITGNVASNLVGRLMSAALVDHLGLAANFYVFAALNLAGRRSRLVLPRPHACRAGRGRRRALAALDLGRAPAERAAAGGFAIGFCILFAFIGTFTYVNFVLVRQPLAHRHDGARVRVLRLPAVGRSRPRSRAARCRSFGTRPTFWGALAVAGAGLPLLLAPTLVPVIAGMALRRDRYVLRAGDGDRLRRPRRDDGPRVGERDLPRLLLLRRSRRAPRSSGSSSTASAGPLASRASGRRSPWRRCSPSVSKMPAPAHGPLIAAVADQGIRGNRRHAWPRSPA